MDVNAALLCASCGSPLFSCFLVDNFLYYNRVNAEADELGLFTAVKPARRIDRALDNFHPDIEFGEVLGTFYVDRGTQSPVEEIRNHLIFESEYPKLILTGPRGAGKSMELMKIQQDRKINRSFFVKVMPMKVSALALITTMLKEVRDVARERKVPFTREMKDANDFLHFRFGWNVEVELWGAPKREVFDEDWLDTSKMSDRKVRLLKKKLLDVDMVTIITWINVFSEEIEKKKKRPVLILVKDLDKLNRDLALEMFDKNGAFLRLPKCFVIYTFPGHLYFDSNFDRIRRNFSDLYFLRNFNPWTTEQYSYCWHYRKMREIASKRIHPKLFDTTRGDIIDDLIFYSGGVPLEYTGLLRQCALIASRKQFPLLDFIKWCYRWVFYPSERDFLSRRIKNAWYKRITPDIKDQVIGRRRDYYRNSLSPKQINTLIEILREPDLFDPKTEEHADMLERDLIIQYGPENQFSFRINPFVREYVAKFNR